MEMSIRNPNDNSRSTDKYPPTSLHSRGTKADKGALGSTGGPCSGSGSGPESFTTTSTLNKKRVNDADADGYCY